MTTTGPSSDEPWEFPQPPINWASTPTFVEEFVMIRRAIEPLAALLELDVVWGDNNFQITIRSRKVITKPYAFERVAPVQSLRQVESELQDFWAFEQKILKDRNANPRTTYFPG